MEGFDFVFVNNGSVNDFIEMKLVFRAVKKLGH